MRLRAYRLWIVDILRNCELFQFLLLTVWYIPVTC
jgi:hypothetical protein